MGGEIWVFKHQDLQIIWSQIKQIWVIFTHLELWVAERDTASSGWKIKLFHLGLQGYHSFSLCCSAGLSDSRANETGDMTRLI